MSNKLIRYQLLLMIVLILFLPQLQARDFELSTAANGVVQKVNVKVGEKVKKGQLLLSLDQKLFAAEVKKSEKMLLSARLNKNEAKKELERAEELYERTVLSDHELNVAKIEFARIDALLAAAESQVEKSAYELKYSQIFSPVNGKVKKINAWPGMLVNNSLKNTILLIISN